MKAKPAIHPSHCACSKCRPVGLSRRTSLLYRLDREAPIAAIIGAIGMGFALWLGLR